MQIYRMLTFFLLSGLLAFASLPASAQVPPAATQRTFSISAGAIGSVFQPDYGGGGIPQTSSNRLYGVGGYVDIKFTRWVQAEAEGRWLNFNQLYDIKESNYLIGPRVPIHTFKRRITPYGKVLFGFSNMTFENKLATGRFTTIAYGGGVDIKMTRRFTLRAFDFEYQQWPNWYNNQGLYPYGGSVGVSYKVF
jgi:hypothetical protein